MLIKFYALIDPRNEEIRYIGRTGKSLSIRKSGHLCLSKSNHNSYKKNWIASLKKLGLKPLIRLIKELDCSWEESHNIEKALIEEYLKDGHRLINLVDKGPGSLGIARPINKSNFKPILQYDLEGNFIKEFESLASAARELNTTVKIISKGLNGNLSSYGFLWRFKTADFPLKITPYKEIPNVMQRKEVLQYDLLGNFIQKFPSCTDAAIKCSGNPKYSSSIGRVLKGGKALGYMWRSSEGSFNLKIPAYKTNKISVKAVSKEQTLVFNSLQEAATFFKVSYTTIRNWCKINKIWGNYTLFFD